MEVAIRRVDRPIPTARLEALAGELLDASRLCAIATVSPRDHAHVNTAYFAWTSGFYLLWLSDPGARHSTNVRRRGTVAVAVYDSHQAWGRSDRGLQLFGIAHELADPHAGEAAAMYAQRFPDFSDAALSAYRLYRFRPDRMKLFDESALGSGVFVTVRVRPRGLAWERTEIYDEDN